MFTGTLIIVLTCLSLLDLIILLLISKGIGIPLIIATQLVTGLWGLWKIKHLDFNLYFFLDAELKKGETIVRELWDEALILVGACMLVIPGFLSDLIGIILQIPLFRAFLLELIDRI